VTIHDRPITPDDLAILDTLPGVLAIGRDQNLCVFWVNGLQEQLSGMKPEEYLGRSLESMMPRSVAEERRRTLEAVLEDNQPRTIYMLAGETRMLVRLLPIDAGAFGHKGVMALMCQAPLGHDPDAQTIATPRTMSNSVLRSLSRRELEVLHLVARGHTTAEIAASLHRTEKAINHHLSGLHRAFHTSTRTELMQEAIKRGIGTFTPDEWLRIVEGEMQLRQDNRATPDPGIEHAPTESRKLVKNTVTSQVDG
jgi:DNA-binding CsgD family transcriptional regulator